MKRLTGALWLCLLTAPATAQEAATARPNLIVILADDLGYGDLTCYGAVDLETPHVDRLAGRGLKFANFYANCPVCSPTRAALLTGRNPDMVGVPGVIRTHPENSWGYLRPDAVLLPQLLSQAGYDTGIVGKWHLGLEPPNTPLDRGFTHFHGFLGDMMDDYYNHRRHGINYMRRGRETIEPTGHATDLFTDWVCQWLRERAGNQIDAGARGSRRADGQDSETRPFFLYLAYNAPHTPIQPPKESLERVQRREPGVSETRARLAALIEHMDAGIGRVLDTLDQTGLAGETLIVFTSDNGGQLSVGADNGPWRDGKQSVYEGGLKVPAICVWPGRIAPGSQTGFMAQTMDVFPTVLAAAGVEFDPVLIDGRSFLPTLLGRSQPPLRQDWFFHRREGGPPYGGKTIEAIRRGPWKLLQNSPFAPQELYHLEHDPQEQHDLRSQEPQIFLELAAALRREIQRYGTVPWQSPDSFGGRQ